MTRKQSMMISTLILENTETAVRKLVARTVGSVAIVGRRQHRQLHRQKEAERNLTTLGKIENDSMHELLVGVAVEIAVKVEALDTYTGGIPGNAMVTMTVTVTVTEIELGTEKEMMIGLEIDTIRTEITGTAIVAEKRTWVEKWRGQREEATVAIEIVMEMKIGGEVTAIMKSTADLTVSGSTTPTNLTIGWTYQE